MAKIVTIEYEEKEIGVVVILSHDTTEPSHVVNEWIMFNCPELAGKNIKFKVEDSRRKGEA